MVASKEKRTEEQTDMKLIVAFRNVAKAHKMGILPRNELPKLSSFVRNVSHRNQNQNIIKQIYI